MLAPKGIRDLGSDGFLLFIIYLIFYSVLRGVWSVGIERGKGVSVLKGSGSSRRRVMEQEHIMR